MRVVPNVSSRDRGDLESYLNRLSVEMGVCFCVEVEAMMPQHVGLGSKTASMLGMALACNAVADGHFRPAALARMSGRGGTSGVGVNATFTGGFVVDGGHRKGQETESFAPSSAGASSARPPLLVRLSFPAKWRVHLFMPKGERCSGAEEESFFSANTPIDSGEAYEVLAAVYHGIAPAVAECDLATLRAALQKIHAAGFKRRELDYQGATVKRLLARLNGDAGMAAGMSSLGPLVYGIGATNVKEGDIRSCVAGLDVTYLGCVRGRNRGYELVDGKK